jgi:hypothetical protein
LGEALGQIRSGGFNTAQEELYKNFKTEDLEQDLGLL